MSNYTAYYWVEKLNLQPHPEGGFYSETYRSSLKHQFDSSSDSERNLATAIYFLLPAGKFSAFHIIKSDETWHHYFGEPLEIVEITAEGQLKSTLLGKEVNKGQVLQYTVPAFTHFAAKPVKDTGYSLVGCTVYPGFDFRDFRLSTAKELLEIAPSEQETLHQLCIK